MSHTAHIEVELNDPDILESVCKRLNLNYQRDGVAKLYDGEYHKGFVIQLNNWRYPIIVKNNDIAFDNYNGSWGDMKEINNLKTYYGVEKVKKLARSKGYMCREVTANGKPQVKIFVK